MTEGQERLKNSPLTITLIALREQYGNLNELDIVQFRNLKAAFGGEEKENVIRRNCEELAIGDAAADGACGCLAESD